MQRQGQHWCYWMLSVYPNYGSLRFLWKILQARNVVIKIRANIAVKALTRVTAASKWSRIATGSGLSNHMNIDTRGSTQINKDKQINKDEQSTACFTTFHFLLSFKAPFCLSIAQMNIQRSMARVLWIPNLQPAADHQWSRKWSKDFWIPHGVADTRTTTFPSYPVGIRAKKTLGTKGAVYIYNYPLINIHACT